MRTCLVLVLGITGALLVSCSAAPPTYTSPSPVDPPATSGVVDTSLMGVWERLRQRAPHRGFVMLGADDRWKTRMELGFAGNPNRFVDCGRVQTHGPVPYDGAYLAWYDRYSPGVNLYGRVVVTLNSITATPDPDKTYVEFRGYYSMKLKTMEKEMPGATAVSDDWTFVEWTFETGGADTQTVRNEKYGTTENRTCRPTHEAERRIIDLLAPETVSPAWGQ